MRDKQERLKRNMVSLFIIFIMISSVIGFMYGGSSQTENYNDFVFKLNGNYWISEINDEKILFDYFPTEVESIEFDFADNLKNRLEIDITSDLEDKNAQSIALLQYKLIQQSDKLGIYFRTGAIKENEFDVSLIKCNDATASIPVIYFKTDNETKIYLQGNCIIAQAKTPADFIRMKDRILYGVLGVI